MRNVARVFAATAVVVAGFGAATSLVYSQEDDLGSVLQRLQDVDPAVRIDAFYALQVSAVGSDDRVVTALIALLSREQDLIESTSSIHTVGENYGEYHGELIKTVASFHDARAMPGLVRAVTSGRMAMEAVADFGRSALEPVIGLMNSNDVDTRDSAIFTIGVMLDPTHFPRFCDPVSKKKIRTALDRARSDGDPDVAKTAVEFAAALERKDIAGDVDGDLKVDCADAAIVRSSFGRRAGQQGFDVRADVNIDGMVDVRDLAFVTQRFPVGVRCQ